MKSLAHRTLDVSESQTFAIAGEVRRLRQEGIDIVSFALGEPDFPSPRAARDAAVEALDSNFTKYTHFDGMWELREAVAEKFRTENALDSSPDRVIISVGGKHSIYNVLMALCERGDEVLIPSPYWVSYPEMVKLTEATPVVISTDAGTSYKITPDLLRRHITDRTKLLIINSPSNPTGMMYMREELEALAAVAREHDFYVLSDELYEKIVFDGREHVSIGSLRGMSSRVITVNGASKIFAMTGWRIGFLTGPPEIIHAASIVQSQSTTNPTSFAQKGVLAALEKSSADVATMVRAYGERRDVITALLSDIPGISFIPPDATFYVWIDVSSYLHGSTSTVRELCEYLLREHRVGIMPGSAFGDPAHIRLSFSCSMDDIKRGVERMRIGLNALRHEHAAVPLG
jgi:aspartate aminotransferase